MWQKYFWVINIIFICFFSLLAAKISNTYILAHFSSPELKADRSPSSSQGIQKKTRRKTASQYLPISQRNIFNSAYTGETDKSTKQEKSTSPLKKTELNVSLIGTVAGGERENSFAIIKDNQSKEQELFQIDDMIQDQAQVLKISRCQVVVLREGQEEILVCEKEEEASRGKKKSAPARRSRTSSKDQDFAVKKVSESDYMIDESEVENALNNINKLMTQVRVVPNFKDGVANGFKVFSIKPNSIFAKIGLKNGDIIQNINDQDITSPDKAFLAFQELKNEKNFTVAISRRGQAKTLHYEIR